MAIDDNTSYELTGYQVKDLASKIRAKADSNSLASVATSGLYSDLTGAPTIPTVYNGTLTIQQNGTTLGTFSANQSANETINITGGGGATVVDLYWDYTTSNLYKESSMTNVVSNSEVSQAFLAGDTIYIHDSTNQFEFEVIYQVIAYDSDSYTITAVSGARIDTYDGNIPDLIIKYTYDYLHTEWVRTVTSLEPFTGATSGAAGTSGLVPTPTTSDPDKFLKGDGTWGTPTDTTYSNFTGATSSVAGTNGLVPAPAAGDNTKVLTGDGTWKLPGLTILKYGTSTYNEALAAYQANNLLYCRASSNSNPGTGDQLRMAFLAYVNAEGTPTEFEFQYYRSVSTKTVTNQGDETFVYKLNKNTGWSVTKRNNYTRITTDSSLTDSFASGVLTLSAKAMTGATSNTAGTAGYVPVPASGDEDKVLKGDATWGKVGASNIDFTTMPVYTDSKSNVALSTSYTTLAKVTVHVPGKYLLLLDASSNSISSSYSLYSRFAIDTSTYNGNYVTVPGGGWGHTSNMCVVDISTANTDVKAEFNSTVAIAASANTRVNLTAIRIG